MKATKHSCCVCGNYNIDLLKVKPKNHYCEYFGEVISQGYHKVSFLELLSPLEYLSSQRIH